MKNRHLLFVIQLATFSIVYGQSKPEAEVFLTKGMSDETVSLSKDSISEIVITEEMILNGTEFNHVVLLCNASYAVEWIYQGSGSPRLYTTQLRTFGNFKDPSTFIHSNIVVLFQERFNEEQTGTYICRAVDDHKLEIGFHLYFLGDFGFPSVASRLVQPKDGDEFVTLPCEATNPTESMQLFKIDPPQETANLTTNDFISYDPTDGFTFKLSDFPNPYGVYHCKAGDKQTFWTITVVPPKSREIQIFPEQDLVSMDGPSNRTFMCKAKEHILITLPNTMDFGKIDYFHNPEEEYPYLAVLRITPDIPLNSMTNYYKINCVTRRSHRVLHTWEFSNIGSDELTVTFDKEQRRVLCCSKSGLSPIHELAKCESHTDCTIKQHCFETGRCEYNFPPKFVDSPRGCTAVEFLTDFPTHAMKCHVGQTSKILHITSTIDNNDIIISDGKVPDSEKILKLLQLGPKKDNVVHLRCIGSMFFFSTNLIFAFEKTDGSMEFIAEELIQNPNSYGPILHMALLPNTKRVHCFAPVTRSTEWRSVSVDVEGSMSSLLRPIESASSSISVVHRSPGRRRPHRKHLHITH